MTFPTRFHDAERARHRFGEGALRLGSFLRLKDPPADAAALALAGLGDPAATFALVDRGATLGASAIPEAPGEVRAYFARADEVPLWVDERILERGGRLLFRAGMLGGIVLGASSLVRGYASPGGNKPLVFSGRLREAAARRLGETGRFVQATCAPGGLRRFAPGYAITLKVRLMHAQVRRMIERSGRWDEAAWGAPINQHDMLGTTLLFSIVWTEGIRLLGIDPSPEEVADYVQLWRYAGFLMGVDPELLPATPAEAMRLGEMIVATQGEPDEDARALTKALLDVEGPPRNFAERAIAPKRREFAAAFTRALLGDDLADKLAVPRTPWVGAVRILRGATRAAERVRGRVPEMERRQIEAGVRYWDATVLAGLGGIAADFRMPARIAA